MFPILFHHGAFVIPSYGAVTALGLLLALFLTQRTARICALNPREIWNLSILSLVAAIIGSRILIGLWNFSLVLHHPLWLLAFNLVHHPLLATAGALTGSLAAIAYARAVKIPLVPLADSLAAPLALGLGFEQLATFLAGSGYGLSTASRLSVTYTDPLAALWSGTPLNIPLHPVQLYSAAAAFLIAAASWLLLSHRRQTGDVAGFAFFTGGTALFLTEFLRDRAGRGFFLGGALDGPQIAALCLILIGAWLLLERKSTRLAPSTPTQTHNKDAQ